jgi:hypothetical protein
MLLVVQGSHLYEKCPEKVNTSSTPACCNCRLAEGEKAHPTNYSGCRHMMEARKRKLQRESKTTKGRVFSSNLTTPCLSFTAVLRSNTATAAATSTPGCSETSSHNEPEHPCAFAAPTTTGNRSVRVPNINSLPLNNMFRVVTVLKKIMTEFNGAMLEEAKTVAITKIPLTLMKQDGHYS